MKNFIKILMLSLCMAFTSVHISHAENSRPCSKEVSIFSAHTQYCAVMAEPVTVIPVDAVIVANADSFCITNATLQYRFTMITSHKVPTVNLSTIFSKQIKLPVNPLIHNYYSYKGRKIYKLRC